MTSVEEFERHRRRLFGLAYRMLGSAEDAEDIVQEAFLRWHHTVAGSVEMPSAWLVKVTTNLCLNRLASARTRRERYVGQWLPEPISTSAGALGPMETAEQSETVSLAFLVLAERLTPSERAVFVLREAFDYSHRDVAELIELSEANCRQLYHRARRRLAGAQLPAAGSLSEHRALVERFLAAARSGDLTALEELLAKDVVSVPDGGPTRGVARKPVRGRELVARYLTSVVSRGSDGGDVVVTIDEVNGRPAILGWSGSTLIGVLAPHNLDADGRVSGIWIMANPQKLRFVGNQLSRSREASGS